MKSHAAKTAGLPLFLLASLYLFSCAGKPHPAPMQSFAPPVSTVPKPPILHPDLPLMATVLPFESVDTDADQLLDEAAKPVPKRRKPPAAKPATETPDTAVAPPAPTAAEQAKSEAEVPAIVGLSSHDSGDARSETEGSIDDTERGLNTIGRPLDAAEEKTAEQIRQYIRQARKALSTGDVDGAHTLAAKAKVLLSELSE
jgi:hypothetical protein